MFRAEIPPTLTANDCANFRRDRRILMPTVLRTGGGCRHVLRHGTVFQIRLEHHGRATRNRVHHRFTHVADLRNQPENIRYTKGKYRPTSAIYTTSLLLRFRLHNFNAVVTNSGPAGVSTVAIAETIESDQQSAGPQTSRTDAAVVAKAHWQHCIDLLHVFHNFRNPGCTSKRDNHCHLEVRNVVD